MSVSVQYKKISLHLLASASLLKLPDHVMKVLFSCVPEVTGYTRMVDTTEE